MREFAVQAVAHQTSSYLRRHDGVTARSLDVADAYLFRREFYCVGVGFSLVTTRNHRVGSYSTLHTSHTSQHQAWAGRVMRAYNHAAIPCLYRREARDLHVTMVVAGVFFSQQQ